MPKFIIFSSLVLFWGFYELSGGADFEPLAREAVAASEPAKTEDTFTLVPETALATSAPAPVEDVQLASAEIVPDALIEAAPQQDIVEPTPVAAPEPETEDTPVIYEVAADWVNMRDGPSTDYAVLTTVPRGTAAELIEVNADGWAQVRLQDSGETGWMAKRLLSDS
ncbi:SH3 domain-containing protein [Yoonia sp. SS1-5]|uniref:SH3 domain-containing protein n=1 Tax=Yoonia rhodophyticola TaxID=3137370 RepID=A0AAN0MAL6_9RHOB